MAFREVSVIAVREMLRWWLAGHGLHAVARLAQADRKTVRRYVGAAVAAGLHTAPVPRCGCFVGLHSKSTRGHRRREHDRCRLRGVDRRRQSNDSARRQRMTVLLRGRPGVGHVGRRGPAPRCGGAVLRYAAG
ncbi:MAG: hypothetical protein GEU74_16545 [Nitriliruptorales bacterium]|nr:hypothetical protein [Nitriliruptorales bacterium]